MKSKISFIAVPIFSLLLAVVMLGCPPRGPRAAFTAVPMQGFAPLEVAFTDHSICSTGILSWAWDFGDGAGSIEQHPVHLYTEPGEYLVSLEVSSAQGVDRHEAAEPISVRLACDLRTGGAFITFLVAEEEEITLWIEDNAFIDEALRLLAAGEQRVPNFLEVQRGGDCDTRWSWRVAPAAVEWADVTIELCDGRPSYVEENLDDWMAQVGGWCPWSALVVEVLDLRE